MTKKEAIKQLNSFKPEDFQNHTQYIDAIVDFYVEYYHLLHKEPLLGMLQPFEEFNNMNNISKISKLVEIIKERDNTPAHNFIIAVCLHRIHKELRKRYKRMSIDNIRLLQMLGD